MDDPQTLVTEHGPVVWRTISRLLGPNEDAADCFQETFVQYIQITATTKVDYSLALLKRIATRRAIDLIRKRSSNRQNQVLLDDQSPASDVEPWQSLAADEFAEGLRAALERIPPDQATVFCLTQLEQMNPPDVAAVMGINVRHVAVLLHRARTTLQGRLAKHLPTTGRRS